MVKVHDGCKKCSYKVAGEVREVFILNFPSVVHVACRNRNHGETSWGYQRPCLQWEGTVTRFPQVQCSVLQKCLILMWRLLSLV